MFSPGTLVVYPAQGVGRVESLSRQEIGGQSADLYTIRILANNVTVMVPVSNAANIGVRPLCSPEEAETVLLAFQDISIPTGYLGQNWNRRYRDYSDRLKSSSLIEVSRVLKELFLIGNEKELSFGERRLLEQAMTLVTSELAIVLERTVEVVKAEIERCFAALCNKAEKNV